MKTVKFFSLLLICLAFALTAHADDEPEARFFMKTKAVNADQIICHLVNLQGKATNITIQGLDQEATFYRGRISAHQGYRQKIDLSRLPEGRYELHIQQGATSKRQVIVIYDQKILLSSITD